MSDEIGREACFWSMTPSSNPGYNLVDRERWITGADGVRRKEKFPQRGHAGDYEDRRAANGVRSILMVRADGNEAHIVLTNAAAHLDPTTPYGQYVMMKARHEGWFAVAQCPAALISTGDLREDTVLVESILKAQPCQRGTYSSAEPCPHAIAERDARRAKQKSISDSKELASKSSGQITAEAQANMAEVVARAVAEQQKQSAVQMEVMMALLKKHGIVTEEAAAPNPPTEKKK